jgi:hypothetical protein
MSVTPFMLRKGDFISIQVDVWEIPSMDRLHAAVGQGGAPRTSAFASPDGRGQGKRGSSADLSLKNLMSSERFLNRHPHVCAPLRGAASIEGE